MKIGLIDVDCHGAAKKWGATIYPNIALAKISRWHKEQGDDVEWALPMTHYDIIYMSKIFSFTPDFEMGFYEADKVVKGGTGYDITSRLPDEIDMLQPDYSIYPNLPKDVAYGFLTRGCIRRCEWCVVPRKEGRIKPYMDIDEVTQQGKYKKAILMDNNILASGDYGKEQIRKIIRRGYRIDFNQAMDARLVTPEWAELLAKVKWIDRRIRFGCDTMAQVKDCEKAIELIDAQGFKGEYFLYCMLDERKGLQGCYDLLNHWALREWQRREYGVGNAVYPYSQPYRNPDSRRTDIPQWQKDMAQWVNKRMIFLSCDFKDFEPRKGFKCREYFMN